MLNLFYSPNPMPMMPFYVLPPSCQQFDESLPNEVLSLDAAAAAAQHPGVNVNVNAYPPAQVCLLLVRIFHKLCRSRLISALHCIPNVVPCFESNAIISLVDSDFAANSLAIQLLRRPVRSYCFIRSAASSLSPAHSLFPASL